MWMMGAIGLRGCNTIETPVAKKLPGARFIAFAVISGRGPCTAENITPPFSMTSPEITQLFPPPPSGRNQLSSKNLPLPSANSKSLHIAACNCLKRVSIFSLSTMLTFVSANIGRSTQINAAFNQHALNSARQAYEQIRIDPEQKRQHLSPGIVA